MRARNNKRATPKKRGKARDFLRKILTQAHKAKQQYGPKAKRLVKALTTAVKAGRDSYRITN